MASSGIPSGVHQNSDRTREITVYTTDGCHKCSVLKEWLKAAKRHFEERNLENVEVMAELVMRNVVVLSAPVIEVDKHIYNEGQFFDGNLLAVNRLLSILEGDGNGQR